MARKSLSDKLFKSSVFRRMVFSFVGVVASTVVVLALILTALFAGTMVEEASLVSEAMLEQTAQASEQLHSQVLSIGAALLADRRILTSLYSREIDRAQEYQTNLVTRSVTTVYPFIRFIAVYNARTDRYINPDGLDRQSESEVVEIVSAAALFDYLSFYPRWISYTDHLDREPARVLTFILYPGVRSMGAPPGALIVNVDTDHIEQIMRTYGGPPGTTTRIVDGTGRIVASTEPEDYLQAVEERAWPQRIEGPVSRTGSFVERVDGRRSLITFTRSETLDWIFLSERPYSAIVENLIGFARSSLLAALFIGVCGVVLSVVLARRVYNPFATLVERVNSMSGSAVPASLFKNVDRANEFELLNRTYEQFLLRMGALEDALKDDLQVHRRALVQSLLLGHRFESFPSEEVRRRVHSMVGGPAFTVVVVSFDHYQSLRDRESASSIANLSLALSQATRDMVASLYQGVVVGTAENEIAALLQVERNGTVDRLVLTELQRTISKSTNLSVSAGIGETVTTKEAIHRSLVSARRALEHRYFQGPGAIVSSAEIEKPMVVDGAAHATQVGSRLIEAARVWDDTEVEKELRAFEKEVRRMNLLSAPSAMHRLYEDLSNEYRRIAKDLSGFMSVAGNDMHACDTLAEQMDEIRDLVSAIVEAGRSRALDKKTWLLREMQSYIENHYGNPALNASMVADNFRVSAGYVGKLFREKTGTTFGQFLNELRLERAAELLRSTSVPVKDLTRAVGIENENYFYTLFRRSFGQSPARYRAEQGQARGTETMTESSRSTESSRD